MSMDTTFPDNRALYRAVTTPWLWHGAYWLIIALQVINAALLAFGAWALWLNRNASASNFGKAKKFAIIGLVVGFMLWFFGFMVIGAEWFLMWQSQQWNGQDAAFMFYMSLLGVLVFICQAEPHPTSNA